MAAESAPLLGAVEYKANEPQQNLPQWSCKQPLQIIGVQETTPLAWSPDGMELAFVSGNKSICVCNRQDGVPPVVVTRVLVGHTDAVTCLSYHPNYPETPLLVSGGLDGLLIWNAQTATLVKELRVNAFPDAHEGGIHCVCWAFGGLTLLSGSKDTNVKLYDSAADWRVMETIFGHKAPVLSIAFNDETGILATTGRDSTVKLWDGSTLAPAVRGRRAEDQSLHCPLLANMDGHRGDVVTLTFLADGRQLFSGARDNTIVTWDVAQRKSVRTTLGHSGDVRRLLLANQEQFMLSAGLDGKLLLWKLVPPPQGVSVLNMAEMEAQGMEDESKALELILTGSSAVLLDEVEEKNELLVSVQVHEENCCSLEINPRFPLMATASTFNCVNIWSIADLAQPQLLHQFVGHTEQVTAMAVIGGGSRLLTASADYNLHVYDLATMRRDARFNFQGSALCMAVTPDERLMFAGGNDYDIKGYSLSGTYQQVCTLSGHSGRVEALSVHPNGALLASGGHDFNIILWQISADSYSPGEAGSGGTQVRPLHVVEAHQGHILGLAFSGDGVAGGVHLASVGNDHCVQLWGVRGGHKLRRAWQAPDAHESAVADVTWGRGPTEAVLYTGSWDQTIKVWSVAPSQTDGSGHPVPEAVLTGHTGRLTALQVSSDGAFLISTSSDYTARVWSATAPHACISAHQPLEDDGAFTCIAAGPTTFLTGSEVGMMRVWPLPIAGDHFHRFFQPYTTAEQQAMPLLPQAAGLAGAGAAVGAATAQRLPIATTAPAAAGVSAPNNNPPPNPATPTAPLPSGGGGAALLLPAGPVPPSPTTPVPAAAAASGGGSP